MSDKATDLLVEMLNIPEGTTKVVLVMRVDEPPVLRITKYVNARKDLTTITQRFKLVLDEK
jgi:hypothetical protein